MPYQVFFFQSNRGEFPVKDFLESLDYATQAKVTHLIELLEIYGPYLKPPHVKKIEKHLYELRVSGKVALRIFYSKVDHSFILLHGFVKKTQRTPSKEIRIALDRLKEVI